MNNSRSGAQRVKKTMPSFYKIGQWSISSRTRLRRPDGSWWHGPFDTIEEERAFAQACVDMFLRAMMAGV
jgi:hypothetical protein